MANEKPAKPTKKKTAARPSRKTAVKKKDASPPEVEKLSVGPAAAAVAKKESEAGTPSEFSGITIGHAAGDVWGILTQGTPRTITELKKAVAAPGDVVVAAVGWLAREDKLDFISNGKTVKIGLR